MNDTKGNTQAEIEALLTRLESYAVRLGKNNSNSASTITVNAGGAGMWIAVSLSLLAAALMFGINVGLAVMVTNHDRKIERLQDYLQVVYTHAPHLKSIAEAEIEKESNR